jgi:hypothetical protein
VGETVTRIIGGSELGEQLVKLGIIPENYGRVIIQIDPAGPVEIHVVLFGEENLLSVNWASLAPASIEDKTE